MTAGHSRPSVRRIPLALMCLFLLPLAVAGGPATTYMDATSRILAPTLGVRSAPALEEWVSASFAIPVDACHNELRVALAWEPATYEVTLGARSVTVDSVLHARLVNETGSVLAERTRAGGAMSFTELVPPNATIDLLLWVDVGANVSAHALVMGWVPASGPACV